MPPVTSRAGRRNTASLLIPADLCRTGSLSEKNPCQEKGESPGSLNAVRSTAETRFALKGLMM
jgi:hypothetical protein